MAQLCAKCGAQMPAGAQLCAACGAAQLPGSASIASTAAQPGPAYAPVNIPGQPAASAGSPPAAGSSALPGYTPVPPPPPAAGYAPGAAYPAPAKSDSGTLKIVLIVIAVLVGLGIVGAGAAGFAVWRIARAVRVANNGEQVTLSAPGGSFSASAASIFTPSELGTEIYPSAQSAAGGGRMSLASVSVVSAVYLTSDSKDQVVSFYKSKLGSEATIYDAANSATISLRKGSRESLMISIVSRPSENNGKTKISIVHTTNKRAS